MVHAQATACTAGAVLLLLHLHRAAQASAPDPASSRHRPWHSTRTGPLVLLEGENGERGRVGKGR
eukprot:1657062-Rhodomonas_salina.1